MSRIAILRGTLMGNIYRVISVAFHPTAPILATGSKDNTAKLWRFSSDGSTATCVATLAGHSDWVWSVAFHPTAPILATGSIDKTVKLWRLSPDSSAATCVATLAGHSSGILSVAFHPTAPILATGSEDKTAKLWRLSPEGSAATCVSTLRIGRWVYSVAFHPTAPILAIGSGDNTAKLWRLSPDGSAVTCVDTLRGHRFSVNSVAFHPTLSLLATGSNDDTAKLWRLSPDGSVATCVATLAGHSNSVISVAFHPTAPILATGSGDNSVKLWQMSPDGSVVTCLDTLVGHSDRINTVAFDSTEPILATGSEDQTVKLWELNIQNLQSLLSSVNNSCLIIHMIGNTKIIKIKKKYLQANKSSPSFIPVYDELMVEDLNGQFRFEFQGQNAIDVTGLTRIVFDKILPIYTNLFFEKSKTSTFIILKEKVDTELLVQHTNQIIKLAKAAKSQILLGINPELIDLLLSEDLKNYFSNNKINKTKNNKNKTEKEKQLEKFYDFVNQAIQNSSFDELNNNNAFLRINKNNNDKNRVIQKYKTKEGEIKNDLLREIRLRRFLVECGFSSWEEVQQMYSFIQTYWNTSNKITVTKNGRQVSLDLFVPELKLDVESFKRRIKIIREEPREIIDLSTIPEDLSSRPEELFDMYPAFKPLLEYILNPSEEANENRKTFVKYVTGTEYSPAEILIKLTNNIMNSGLHRGQPFYGHSCCCTIDLYKAPEAPQNFTGEITQNMINIQLRAAISSFNAAER
jgi:WD40 repeat protein